MGVSTDAIIVGLTGSFGSGCSTVADMLDGFKKFSLSEPVRAEWAAQHKESEQPTRRDLQNLGNELRRQNGPDFLAREVHGKVAETPGAERIVVDSFRNQREVDFFRDRFRNFFLVAVLCPQNKRWERLRDKYLELQLTEQDFFKDDVRDQIEEVDYGQQVQLCVDDADIVFSNEETHPTAAAAQSSLAGTLKPYVNLMTGEAEAPIAPRTDEIAMTIAYTQGRRSMCLKRHVGAVITDRGGNVIATGFNENPVTMEACFKEFRYCYKDSKISEFLRGMPCPECGRELPELDQPFRCPNTECNSNLKLHFFQDRGMRWCTALHAEERALRNAAGRELTDATLYSTTFPCFNCARQIAHARIRRVVYVEPYPHVDGLWLLPRNGVTVDQFYGVKARAFDRLYSSLRAAMEQQYRLKGGSA